MLSSSLLGTPEGLCAFFSLFNKEVTKEELQSLLFQSPQKNETFSFERKTSRKKSSDVLKAFQKKACFFGGLLRFLPFVRGVAICNTVAMRVAESESDIDLFIILQKNRLWMGRLFVTVFLHMLGVRRHGEKISGRLCLSFFVTSESLEMKNIALQDGEDPYLALWTATIYPLFGRDVFEQFYTRNREFLKSYGLTFWNAVPQKKEKYFSFPFFVSFGDFLEDKVRNIFLPRTQKKRDMLTDSSGTILSDTMLKFHNVDKREEFREKWKLLLHNPPQK